MEATTHASYRKDPSLVFAFVWIALLLLSAIHFWYETSNQTVVGCLFLAYWGILSYIRYCQRERVAAVREVAELVENQEQPKAQQKAQPKAQPKEVDKPS
jgi:hypothetical protein